jgi:DNA ligase-1
MKRVLFRPSSVSLAICLMATFLLAAAVVAEDEPALLLAETYRQGIDLDAYWVSEKLDGVRAYWDGSQLISRGGNAFAAPPWFTANFPPVALDGELWVGRGQFEKTASIVSRHTPHDGWRQVRYMVFDLPRNPGTFDERLQKLRAVVGVSASAFLAVIPQTKVADHKTLLEKLDSVVASGGEGLMLHRGASRYHGGRSTNLLKLKQFDDAEGIVIAHNPGRGRLALAGMMGSVTVRTAQNTTVKIGSGFTDAERQNPPPIGATITFKHQGFTAAGKPRFPVFWRLRKDEPAGRK